ncbi:imidazolonepropionase [Filobacillus milosensis]|uniref:Imidazolonepropionase n=1 Tax=Filobacillus milosensis TaxID=94137 RepID=A0A4Y8IH33_9BACI|nr:amidohydrolase family protein [Filobacillus milosensis]TFB14265.1 imidazolonepropionase [Filobacillus milosensis]
MSLLLKNGNVIDVHSGEVSRNSILIKNDRILQIGQFQDDADEVINLEGKYIIPGLIDMHCHIKEGFAHLFTAVGVTTVRNTAGNVIELRDLIQAPSHAPTPRVYSADRLIDGPPGLWGPTSPYSLNASDPNEAKSEVRRQIQEGAQFIKVYGLLSPEVMEAVTSEAHQHGVEVSCDLIHSTQVNALEAAKMGVKWFEHNSGFMQAMYPEWSPLSGAEVRDQIDLEHPNLDKIQEVCEEMLKYDAFLCPTTVVYDQANRYPKYWRSDERFINEALLNQWEQISQYADALKQQIGCQTEYIKAITKTYYDLGGTVVAGTDTPAGVWTYPGMALHRELELLVESGLSELQALQSATITAAQSINYDDLGVIAPGKVADLLVLDSHPLLNIKHAREIDSIIKGGKLYQQEELLNMNPDEQLIKNKLDTFIKDFEEQMN